MPGKNSAAMATATPSDREILFTRVFDTPRELVWKAWTEREHVERWWGPHGFSTTTEMMDVKPGGLWVHTMHGPDGKNYPNKKVYREVVKPERLVYSHGGGRKGEPQVDSETTVTLEQHGGKTKLTMRMLFASAEARDLAVKTYGAVEGGNQTLGRLADFLPTLAAKSEAAAENRGGKTVLIAEPGKPTTILSRVFDAPRRLVYEAYTNPKHIEKWWGRRRLKTVVDKLDVRPGGLWRFVQHGTDGEKFAFSGEFREIVPQERIVSTFEFEAMPGHVILNTVLLEEYEGKTKVTVSSIYQSVEDREEMVRAGMEIGANEAWNMLDELLTGEAKDGAWPDLVLTRELNAPPELVWKAWTDAKHLAQWWGPKGFTNPMCEVDARPGGAILIRMRAPDGRVYPMKATFEEVMAPERLVFLSGAMDEAGNLLFEVRNTVTFAEVAGKTRVTVRAHVVSETAAAPAYLAGMEMGWTQSLQRLESFVAKR